MVLVREAVAEIDNFRFIPHKGCRFLKLEGNLKDGEESILRWLTGGGLPFFAR